MGVGPASRADLLAPQAAEVHVQRSEVRPFAYLQIEEADWLASQARDGEVKDPQLEAREGSG